MKKFISLFLTICMILSLTSAFTFTASAKSDDDIVKIKVTATPKDAPSDDEKYRVPVKGATVNMYKGQGLKGDDVSWVTSDTTDSDGYAEFDLSGYSEDERAKLTFSAQKVVASGSGIGDGTNGGNRDALFSLYNEPRLQLELHSETIDSNGNWLGKKLPTGNGNDIDLAFVIDASGSMGDDIENVRNNIQKFTEYLADEGYDLRIAIVDYNRGSHGVEVHKTNDYSPWFKDVNDVKDELSKISTTGGTNEPLNSLGYLTDWSSMNWRSSASKFAFLLTDSYIEGSYSAWGYSSIDDVAIALTEENVAASVITTTNQYSVYNNLAEKTGGKMVDINSSDFASEMKTLADGIVGKAGKDLELHLQEPRLLVNLAICYHESDEYNEKESNTYYNSVRNFASNLSKNLAQATDGHLMVNKVLLGKTNRIESFFTNSVSSSSLANMADIKIVGDRKGSAREWSYVDSDGKTYWFKPLNITQNAYTGGFYTDVLIDASLSSFKNLGKDVAARLENNYSEFERMQLSAYMNYGEQEITLNLDELETVKEMPEDKITTSVNINIKEINPTWALTETMMETIDDPSKGGWEAIGNGFAFVTSWLGNLVEITNLSVSLDSNKHIMIEYGEPIETKYSGKKLSLSELLVDKYYNFSPSIVFTSSDKADELIRKWFNLSGDGKYFMDLEFGRVNIGDCGYKLLFENGEAYQVPVLHKDTKMNVYYSKNGNTSLLFDAAKILENTRILMPEEEKHKVLTKIKNSKIALRTEYNIDEDTEKWSKVATHEAGHYIIGLFDDYLSAFLDGEGNEVMWGNTYFDSNGQTQKYRDAPNSDYGLMDNNLLNISNDIELSSDRDYLYLNRDYNDREINTAHSFKHKKSAERVFAELLENGVAYTNDAEEYLYKNVFNIPYKSKYSISKTDRLADYGFASLSNDDYIWYESGNTSNIVSSTIVETSTNSISAENILFKNSITATTNGVVYKSPYDELHAYFIPDQETTYTISSYDKQLLFDEYFGVNLPFVISSSNEVNTQGELLSTASIGSDIDYSTISWFKIVDNVWTKLDTTLEKEENMNIGARCDYDGEGTYVLMAKLASDEGLQAVTNLDYTNPTDRDGIVNLTFDDPNSDTVYYNIYYSDKKFSSTNDKDVVMEKRYAGSDSYSIDLGERNATGYAAVVAIAENGTKSELSEVIRITTGEADRDGDGIPDWYCDKYSLWPESGEEKDIANSDDDKDGLTNLEEYKGGSDPTDPNDPRKTSKTAVKSVSLSDSSINLSPGGSSVVNAKLNPSDATNKNVKWYVDDNSIATVSVDGLSCDILGIKEGTTKVTVVTEDGGYTDSVTVKVSNSSSVSFKPSGKDYYVLKDVAVSNGYEYFDYPEKKSANIRSASYILAFQDNNKLVSYKTVLGDTGIVELDKAIYEDGGKLYVSAIDLQTKLVKYFPNFPTSTPSEWAEEEIARAINAGLVTDSVKVNYQRNITREQFCELVVKLYEKATGKTVSKEDNRFNDTNNPEILKAYKLGIVNGVSKTKFAPYNLVTRQEICAMLVRAVDAMYPNVDINDYQYHSFKDNDKISGWAMSSVQFAYDNDIMKGVGANEISPLGNTTCEQAILLINRIYESKF